MVSVLPSAQQSPRILGQAIALVHAPLAAGDWAVLGGLGIGKRETEEQEYIRAGVKSVMVCSVHGAQCPCTAYAYWRTKTTIAEQVTRR